jgi:predicted DNA-binding WGR domain protein
MHFRVLTPKGVSAITLHRTDLAKNMCRFYRLDWQRDLSRRP